MMTDLELPHRCKDAVASGGRPPILIADHLALDFLNSRARPDGIDVEWLTDLPGLLRWAKAAGIVDADALAPTAADADAVVAAAIALREWLRGVVARHSATPLTPFSVEELGPLNRLLVKDHSYRELLAGAGRPIWSTVRYRSGENALIQPLARTIAELFCTADFNRVRQCEGDACVLWFLDVTKNNTRRWCDMAICGNRAKVRAHRARSRK